MEPLQALVGLFILFLIFVFASFVLFSRNSTSISKEWEIEAKKNESRPQSISNSSVPSEQENILNANAERYERLYRTFFKYIAANQSQDRYVFLIAIGIIFLGLFLIFAGLILGTAPISNASIFAGVLTEFIAGTILVVFRSVNRQTQEFFKVLQDYVRLEAALRIISEFEHHSDENSSIKTEKMKMKAEMARLLITLQQGLVESDKSTK